MRGRRIVRGLGPFVFVMLTVWFVEKAGAESPYTPAPTVWGQSGALTIGSPEVLAPGTVRASVAASAASGGTANRFDRLLMDAGADTTSGVVRGALAMGLPSRVEIVVMVPYHQLHVDQVSTDGVGDLTVSGKVKLRDEYGWKPAAAMSIAWTTETSRGAAVSSVTTHGYRATVSAQLTLIVGEEQPWTIVAEAGGFWRDPGRPEGDSSLEYGVAWYTPIATTGLYPITGELEWLSELSGATFRNDTRGLPNDATSLASGLRYVRKYTGLTLAATYTMYRAVPSESSLGGTLTWHWSFF